MRSMRDQERDLFGDQRDGSKHEVFLDVGGDVSNAPLFRLGENGPLVRAWDYAGEKLRPEESQPPKVEFGENDTRVVESWPRDDLITVESAKERKIERPVGEPPGAHKWSRKPDAFDSRRRPRRCP